MSPLEPAVEQRRRDRRRVDAIRGMHPATFARVRAACCPTSSRQVNLDLHAAEVTLVVETARARAAYLKHKQGLDTDLLAETRRRALNENGG